MNFALLTFVFIKLDVISNYLVTLQVILVRRYLNKVVDAESFKRRTSSTYRQWAKCTIDRGRKTDMGRAHRCFRVDFSMLQQSLSHLLGVPMYRR
jgi:hypothetical protein